MNACASRVPARMPKCLQQRLADEMRRPTRRRADAEVDARLAEVESGCSCAWQSVKCSRLTLPNRSSAVVERRARGEIERRRRVDGQTGGGRRRDGLEKFAAIHG